MMPDTDSRYRGRCLHAHIRKATHAHGRDGGHGEESGAMHTGDHSHAKVQGGRGGGEEGRGGAGQCTVRQSLGEGSSPPVNPKSMQLPDLSHINNPHPHRHPEQSATCRIRTCFDGTRRPSEGRRTQGLRTQTRAVGKNTDTHHRRSCTHTGWGTTTNGNTSHRFNETYPCRDDIQCADGAWDVVVGRGGGGW